MLNPINTSIGPYTITRELGRGGMGVVYFGRDTRLDRDVAIKALPEHLAQDPERLARFEREAKTLAQLHHPNVAGIYGVEEHDGARYLVLEYVEGETLAQRLDRGAIPVDEALEIAIQIAAGVEAAHEAGVIHRDLKPGNVIVTPDGKAKVLDFGLARAEESSSSMSMSSGDPTITSPAQHSPTMPGVILGTAAYMSPEQARGRPVDKRTDIWSFGVVLCEMLTGASPFVGETVSDSIGAVLHKHIDLKRLPSATPSVVRHVLQRCLTREKSARYRDIGDVRIELERGDLRPPGHATDDNTGGDVRIPWIIAGVLAIALAIACYFGVGAARPPVTMLRASLLAPEQFVYHLSGADPGPPSLSPDGTKVAFCARDEAGIVTLWIRNLDQPTPMCLPGTERAQYPFWSPDSRAIAFFAKGKLWRMDLSGGAPLALADAPNGKGGSWGSDDVILFAPEASEPIYRVSSSGGQSEAITTVHRERNENSHRHPRWLPDGEHFLYLARQAAPSPKQGMHVVRVASTDGSIDREVLRSDTNIELAAGKMLYVSDGSLIARPFDPVRLEFNGKPTIVLGSVKTIPAAAVGVFSAAGDRAMVYMAGEAASLTDRLVWYGRDGQQQDVLADSILCDHFRVSPNGAFVVAHLWDPTSGMADIWMLDARSGRRDRFAAIVDVEPSPIPSPDSERIAFLSARGGDPELYTQSIGGFEEAQLLIQLDERVRLTCWTRDGSEFLADSLSRKQEIIYAIEAEGSGTIRKVLESSSGAWGAQVSPDGKWMAFNSYGSSEHNVEVTTFPKPGRLIRISTTGGAWASWNDDGTELYYQGTDGVLNAVSVEQTDNGLRFGEPQALFDTGQPLDDTTPYPRFQVTADGQRFLVMERATQTESPAAHIIQNWTLLLEPGIGE